MTVATLPETMAEGEAKATFLAALIEGQEMTGQEVANLLGVSRKTGDARKKAWKQEAGEHKVLAFPATSVSEPAPGPEAVEVAVEPPTPVEAPVEPPSAISEDSERQPVGAWAIAYSGFILGAMASLFANVTQAEPSFVARAIGAFVPLALIIAVECLMRAKWLRGGKVGTAFKFLLVGAVAVITAVISFRHIKGLALANGADSLEATLLPLAIDGLMTICGLSLWAMKPKNAQQSSSVGC